ncbi:MAG: sigma-70 family RNA polymerase sigma factor [Epulopiscium sp.]|jgi:RNA polymerase sigma-70 factor (ECF subfamily)|nr:sigma-70 family RNA polymerase sigma factor [Candidatus Epulonipiscium sp.]HOQ17167.1 sigma-70 family RNA polymerase sigma factor [Defluviitaleaceae bacterium]
MEGKEEKLLVKRAKKGNISAFEELIIEHESKVYNIAYRILNNEEDAKDLSQEVFIKAFNSLHKFREDSSFSTWLYRIAMNTCIDELRKRKGRESYSIDRDIQTDEGTIPREFQDKQLNPEEELMNKELASQIQWALNHLSETYKEVIILRDFQGFDYKQISQILGCSLGTVKSRISRARTELKNVLIKEKHFDFKNRLKTGKEGN